MPANLLCFLRDRVQVGFHIVAGIYGRRLVLGNDSTAYMDFD